jgi:hypothetical protein
MRSDIVPGAIFPDYELSDHTAKRRPVWDIATPELRAAWQQGRKELFYPYGKTYAQTLSEQD